MDLSEVEYTQNTIVWFWNKLHIQLPTQQWARKVYATAAEK